MRTRPSLLHRPRRLRASAALRGLVRETTLDAGDFIYPLFVAHGRHVLRPIASMPGVNHHSVDTLLSECAGALDDGVRAVLLFGLPESKDAVGSEAYADDGIVQRAVRALKRELPDLLVITDVCLCEYTDHGHCGVVSAAGDVENDPSLDLLSRTAVSHAAAGADIVAPSDMMDGRIGAIRAALDDAGFSGTTLMSYAAKYASAFYGPFRDAAGSAPAFGDRRSYQMDPANRREALREVRLDVDEGADIIMVKPGLAYLDIVRDVRDAFPELPLAAYNVSGEYAMVKAAAANGWLDERRVVLELLTGFRRAGADVILTYHAREAARWLADG